MNVGIQYMTTNWLCLSIDLPDKLLSHLEFIIMVIIQNKQLNGTIKQWDN